ncbi:hypothetical protein LZ575_10895 [Antarcticibacterium sp. 1MA-6-2]|uniref:hypothetical protein n=1 Tax=Antarcticibacterium sp. 1MA-6-2 TaxID=2908210 RepID=UPI001F3A29F4|nr:hypothetical protein [Antarcticibacterium sp. 1MA-6-2]UJH92870.1 hypothetical protein LZ575_10895 [Antarcticibacterium sp. 1MA-6-2]
MDQVLKLVNEANESKLLQEPEVSNKLGILILMDLVERSKNQLYLTSGGRIALKMGFQEYEKMTNKEIFPKTNSESDRAILYFIRNWNKQRIIGISTWIILIALWAVLKMQ